MLKHINLGAEINGLTIEQIKEGGSKIRNRCIAEIFTRMKIIESWGQQEVDIGEFCNN